MQAEKTTPEHVNETREEAHKTEEAAVSPTADEAVGQSPTEPQEAQGQEAEPQEAHEEAQKEEEAAPEPSADSELEQWEKRYNEMNERYLRLLAEYDNFRKRSARERDEIYPGAVADTVGKFLPVLDNFERAAQFIREDDELSRGFEMIYKSFCDVLTALGVEAVGEVGEPFNPQLHNAVMHIEDPALGENVIAQVLQKGYKIGERVVRYAMVQTAN